MTPFEHFLSEATREVDLMEGKVGVGGFFFWIPGVWQGSLKELVQERIGTIAEGKRGRAGRGSMSQEMRFHHGQGGGDHHST